MAGIAGLVLAGGIGSRFGGPKAWALLPDGRTFLDACLAVLCGAGATPVVSTLPPGAIDPMIEDLIALPLPEDGLDMFASIRIGLARLVHEGGWNRVALLPVDHPLVRPATVRELAAAERPATIPDYRGKHGHPVVIDRSTAESIAGGLMGGPTLREVLRLVGAASVVVNDPGTIANCNTPAALERALRATG